MQLVITLSIELNIGHMMVQLNIFNTLHTFLLMDEDTGVTTSENLMVRIDNHIYRLAEKSFRPYFDHVSFH